MLDCYRTSQTGSDGGWVKHRLQWCISIIAVHFTFDGEGRRTSYMIMTYDLCRPNTASC